MTNKIKLSLFLIFSLVAIISSTANLSADMPVSVDSCEWSPANHICKAYPSGEPGGHYHICTTDTQSHC